MGEGLCGLISLVDPRLVLMHAPEPFGQVLPELSKSPEHADDQRYNSSGY
jgi:hypothetical protein